MKTTIAGATAKAVLNQSNPSILDKVRNGIPLYEVAGTMGISTAEASERMQQELRQEQKKKKLDNKNEVIWLHASGTSNQEIARQTGLSLTFITKTITVHYAKQLTIEKVRTYSPEKDKKASPEVSKRLRSEEKIKEEQDVIASFKNGMKVNAIARLYGIKPHNVYAILYNNHLHAHDNKPVEKIIAAYTAGISVNQIIKDFKLSKKVICLILRKSGMYRSEGWDKGAAHEQFLKIKQLHEQGKSYVEIAKLVNMHHCRVAQILRLKGVAGLVKDDKKAVRQEIIRLYNDGASLTEISKRFNKKRTYLAKFLRKVGFSNREKIKKMKTVFNNGKSISEIAVLFNVTAGHTLSYLKRAGVQVPTIWQQDKMRIAAMYNQGIKIYEISEKEGMSRSGVIANLVKQGLIEKELSWELKCSLIKEEAAKGMDSKTLAIKYVMKEHTIKRILKNIASLSL